MTATKNQTGPTPAQRSPHTRAIPVRREGAIRIWWYRFKRYRTPGIIIPAAVFIFMVLFSFLGPVVVNAPPPSTGNLADYMLPIGSPGHILGTNAFGNDTLSQLMYGGQTTITVAVCAMALGLFFGALLGMLAGYFQRVAGPIIMRVLDVIFAFPDIILAIAIAAYLGPSLVNAIWAIGFFSIASFGRITRAQTLRVVHMDFIVAARSSGTTPTGILVKHIWPNISGRVFAYALVAFGYAMMAEAALSFLGLGVPLPTPSWGNIIGTNQAYISTAPHLLYLPALCMFLTIVSVNLFADAIQQKRASD